MAKKISDQDLEKSIDAFIASIEGESVDGEDKVEKSTKEDEADGTVAKSEDEDEDDKEKVEKSDDEEKDEDEKEEDDKEEKTEKSNSFTVSKEDYMLLQKAKKEKAQEAKRKAADELKKSVAAAVQAENDALKGQLEDLKKSVQTITDALSKPNTRQTIAQATVLEKSNVTQPQVDAPKERLSKSQTLEALDKLADEGKISPESVMQFEVAGTISNLNDIEVARKAGLI